jgi:hypothetical protein
MSKFSFTYSTNPLVAKNSIATINRATIADGKLLQYYIALPLLGRDEYSLYAINYTYNYMKPYFEYIYSNSAKEFNNSTLTGFSAIKINSNTNYGGMSAIKTLKLSAVNPLALAQDNFKVTLKYADNYKLDQASYYIRAKLQNSYIDTDYSVALSRNASATLSSWAFCDSSANNQSFAWYNSTATNRSIAMYNSIAGKSINGQIVQYYNVALYNSTANNTYTHYDNNVAVALYDSRAWMDSVALYYSTADGHSIAMYNSKTIDNQAYQPADSLLMYDSTEAVGLGGHSVGTEAGIILYGSYGDKGGIYKYNSSGRHGIAIYNSFVNELTNYKFAFAAYNSTANSSALAMYSAYASANAIALYQATAHDKSFATYDSSADNVSRAHYCSTATNTAIAVFSGKADYYSIAAHSSYAKVDSIALNNSNAQSESFARNDATATWKSIAFNRSSAYNKSFANWRSTATNNSFANVSSYADNYSMASVSSIADEYSITVDNSSATISSMAKFHATATNKSIAMYNSSASDNSLAMFDSTATDETISLWRNTFTINSKGFVNGIKIVYNNTEHADNILNITE